MKHDLPTKIVLRHSNYVHSLEESRTSGGLQQFAHLKQTLEPVKTKLFPTLKLITQTPLLYASRQFPNFGPRANN